MNSEEYKKIINCILKEKFKGAGHTKRGKSKEEKKLSKKCEKFRIFYDMHDDMLKLYFFMRKYHLLPTKVWKCVVQEHEKDALMHEKHTRTKELEKLKLDTETETPYLQHDYFLTTNIEILLVARHAWRYI